MVSQFGWNKVRCPQRCLLECDKQALNSSAMETGNIPCRRSQFRHKAKNITEVFPGNHKYRCHYKCTTGLRHYSWETCWQKRHFPCCENGSRLLGHIWSSLKKRKSLQLSLVPRIPPALGEYRVVGSCSPTLCRLGVLQTARAKGKRTGSGLLAHKRTDAHPPQSHCG